jgi:salicylate hydroxylase
VEGAAYVTREWDPEKVRTRYDWLFEYDATRVGILPEVA